MGMTGEGFVAPLNFYRPNYHVKTSDCARPSTQMSTAAAITLGLIPGTMHRTACTHCLNLLVTYPGVSVNSTIAAWLGTARSPGIMPTATHPGRLAHRPVCRGDRARQGGEDRGGFERMCISMITHPNSDYDTLVMLKQWVKKARYPSLHPVQSHHAQV
jgi:biotin synthase